ncbi:MAG: fibronectin type III domain-containing protein [candidate division WOR-3 bacterium]
MTFLKIVLLIISQPVASAGAAELAVLKPAPPVGLQVFDTPNDDGRSLTLRWQPGPGAAVESYVIMRADRDSLPVMVAALGGNETEYLDEDVVDNRPYRYWIGAVAGTDTAWSELSRVAVSRPQWLNTFRINVLVGMLVFFALVIYFIQHARAGRQLFVRRIAGLDAVEEAVGRATEMGKPIVYVPGLGGVSDIATIASINILGEVAKKTAQYDSALLVPNRDPIVYTVVREVVKEAYTKAGRPDAFRPDNVFFVTQEQFAYAAAVDGLMVREKPATNFFLGTFWAESLILAETGATTGAIQIAGTDSVFQLPFFITACDYTLIGEELYAASAYLSREPLLLGSLKGQDYGKMIVLLVIVLGSVCLLLSKIPALGSLTRVAELFAVR